MHSVQKSKKKNGVSDERKDSLLMERQSNSGIPVARSSADELKKYKELLDTVVISQDELDTKKKQLLNL